MLQITVGGIEIFDPNTSSFKPIEQRTVTLEHSLYAISKWESHYHKSYFEEGKNTEETVYYIKCMVMNDDFISTDYFSNLDSRTYAEIESYINDPFTATKIYSTKTKKPKKNRTLTSELVYYWMVALQIPFECQYWNLNRLMTLIEIANIEQSSDNKMTKKDIYKHNSKLNKDRKKKYNTNG